MTAARHRRPLRTRHARRGPIDTRSTTRAPVGPTTSTIDVTTNRTNAPGRSTTANSCRRHILVTTRSRPAHTRRLTNVAGWRRHHPPLERSTLAAASSIAFDGTCTCPPAPARSITTNRTMPSTIDSGRRSCTERARVIVSNRGRARHVRDQLAEMWRLRAITGR